MDLRPSPLESKRFGLRVYRAAVDAIDADDLIEALDREHVDIAILRMPAPSLGSLEALRRRGLAPIVADKLVHYDIDLDALTPRPLGSEPVMLRPATHSDTELLESLAREIFVGYVTHYHANPLLPPEKILDGYAEWAASPVRTKAGGDAAWLVEAGGETAGFSCYRIDQATRLATGVLNGIRPAHRGRGVYRRMLQQMLMQFRAFGLQRFAIATQMQNVKVQRIWVSEGLTLRREDHTVHINALRGVASTEPTMPDDATEFGGRRFASRRTVRDASK